MLIEVVAKLCGGMWVLKERYQTSQSRVVRWFSHLVYTRALKAKRSLISINAKFETIPIFPHGIDGVGISGGSSVGRNCVIFQHVEIASNTLIDSPGLGCPVIGDNCYIGVNAKIVGNVTVGNNVRIGANTVVVKNVPDNSVVISGRQHVITRDYPLNNRFYHKYKGRWRYFDNGMPYQVVDVKELEILESRFPTRRHSSKNTTK